MRVFAIKPLFVLTHGFNEKTRNCGEICESGECDKDALRCDIAFECDSNIASEKRWGLIIWAHMYCDMPIAIIASAGA